MSKKETIEFEDVREEPKKGKKVNLTVTDIVTGNSQLRRFLSQQIWFIVFIAGLIFLYIHNRYAVERIAKERQQLQQEVKNLKAEATITGADLMGLSSQAAVKKEIDKRGLDLKETSTPPIILKISKD